MKKRYRSKYQKILVKFRKIPKHIKIYKINNYKKLDNICGVYTFLDKNKKVIYIGASVSIGKRIYNHISELKNKTHSNKKLLEAWKNTKIIYVGLLEKFKTPLEAEQKEQNYIKRWPAKLLNKWSYNTITLPEKDIQRFWSKVNIKEKDECWEWTGTIDNGYGRIWIDYIHQRAHRISYKIANPDVDLVGCIIRHKCDNRSCVNPNHLEIGSNQDNAQDKAKLYKIFGEEKNVSEWLNDKRCNVSNRANLLLRIRRGWNLERAITLSSSIYGPKFITIFGETKNMKEWVDDSRCFVSVKTFRKRLKQGIKPEEALKKRCIIK